MSIRYRCEECGKAFKIRDSLAGTKGRCPSCRVKFTVPMQSTLTEEEFAAAEQEQPAGSNGSSLNLGEESPSGTSLEPASKPKLPTTAPSSSSKLPPPAEPKNAEAVPPAVPKSSPKLKPAPPVSPPPDPDPVEAAAAPEQAPDVDGQEPQADDFDAAAFLMDDSDPNAKKTAGLSTQPAQTTKPATDALGRRYFGAGPKAAAAPPPEDTGSSVVTKAQLPSEEPRRKIDWKATRKELVRRSPLIVLFALLAGVAYWIAGRFLTPGLPLPPLSSVTGKVQVDGKPLSGVVVHLTPINATQAKSTKDLPIRLTDAIGVTNDSGEFQLSYLGLSGAPLGKSRIWLEPLTPADYKRIPARYQQAGSDIRDVREAGNDLSKFTLEIKSE